MVITGTVAGLDGMTKGLLLVHVAGTDGTDFAIPPAKSDEDRTPLTRGRHRDEALLGERMAWVGGEAGMVGKRILDLGTGKPVLFTLRDVAYTPVKGHEFYVRMCGQSRGGCFASR